MSIAEFSILLAISSFIWSPEAAIKSEFIGSWISCKAVLPTILSSNFSTTSSFFFKGATLIPLKVPQSSCVIITSWETSTSLRVKYPASAVFNAVSARPFLAPWVEIKYSKIDKPSLKFDNIGFSIISPPPAVDFFGFAIRPLIPESCRICSLDPLAPESNIIYTELNPCWSSLILFIESSVNSALVEVHISITWLYLSLFVIKPIL